jgi:TIR domain
MAHEGPWDVFISYSSDDASAAEGLETDLRRAGLHVWRDSSGISPGDRFVDEIAVAIDSCQTVVWLISQSSIRSEWVHREISYAVDRGKRIIPLHLGENLNDQLPARIRFLIPHTSSAILLDQNRASTIAAIVESHKKQRRADGLADRGTAGALIASQSKASRRRRAVAFGIATTAALVLLVERTAHFADTTRHPGGPSGLRPLCDSKARQPQVSIRRFEVRHFAKVGPKDSPMGLMGEKSFKASQEDAVTLAVELSEPAYCYLISCRPDGTEELCFPEEATTPPPLTDRPHYPWRDNGMSIGLDEGSGLQAFFTVVSRHRLPPYADWRKTLGESPWRKTEAMPQVVWQYDGQDLKAVTPDGVDGTRGKGRSLQVGEVLGRTGDWLRGGSGIEAIAGVGFHVGPPRGP